MKTTLKTLILLFIIFCSFGRISATNNSNDSISNGGNDTTTYAFPIGAKFTLKLIPTDSKNYKYTVLNFQKIDYAIDYSETDSLLEIKPVPETIECVFARGTDQEGPFKSVLIIRNNTKKTIYYEALISYIGQNEFMKTSVTPLFPGVRSSELWNNNLSAIVIQNISNKK